MTYKNGAVYNGEWLNGHKHGIGTMTYPDGDSFEGSFSCGTRHGNGVMIDRRGKKSSGVWKNGQRCRKQDEVATLTAIETEATLSARRAREEERKKRPAGGATTDKKRGSAAAAGSGGTELVYTVWPQELDNDDIRSSSSDYIDDDNDNDGHDASITLYKQAIAAQYAANPHAHIKSNAHILGVAHGPVRIITSVNGTAGMSSNIYDEDGPPLQHQEFVTDEDKQNVQQKEEMRARCVVLPSYDIFFYIMFFAI